MARASADCIFCAGREASGYEPVHNWGIDGDGGGFPSNTERLHYVRKASIAWAMRMLTLITIRHAIAACNNIAVISMWPPESGLH
jgi:hypothetical protein